MPKYSSEESIESLVNDDNNDTNATNDKQSRKCKRIGYSTCLLVILGTLSTIIYYNICNIENSQIDNSESDIIF